MIETYIYQEYSIRFFKNCVSAYDLLSFLLPNYDNNQKQNILYQIKENRQPAFGNYKFVKVVDESQNIKDLIFLNTRQVESSLHFLEQKKLINNYIASQFRIWYTGIIDQCFEIWTADRNEEKIQDQLILLAGYGNIKLRQEVTVLSLPNSQQKTRRYDIVQFVNRTNTVKIRELKSRKITLRDIEITLSEKGYYEIAINRWPDKNIQLIFSSLQGIDEDAQHFINEIEGISYEDVQDLGLRLYINALQNTPIEGWYFIQKNVASKFMEILPPQKLLKAAEDSILKQL